MSRVGSDSSSSIVLESSSEPSGLLGEVMKNNLGRYISTALWMASRSSEKSALRGTSMQRAALSSASNGYIPKVGGQDRMQSSGSRKTRINRSINSSAPAPANKYSSPTPVNLERDFRSARLSGSG